MREAIADGRAYFITYVAELIARDMGVALKRHIAERMREQMPLYAA